MKLLTAFAFIGFILTACTTNKNKEVTASAPDGIIGTWQLLNGTIVENGKTTVTDYTKDVSFIKIINDSHFAFLQHDRHKGKDSAAVFVAGGGSYRLQDSIYTEHLEYCSAREWEGNDFTFTIRINNDTLIQQGTEKVAGTTINRINTEKYIRVKK